MPAYAGYNRDGESYDEEMERRKMTDRLQPDDKTLIERLELIANEMYNVVREEIEEVCDAAAARIKELSSGPVSEDSKDAARYRMLRFLLCEDASGDWPATNMTMPELDAELDGLIVKSPSPATKGST